VIDTKEKVKTMKTQIKDSEKKKKKESKNSSSSKLNYPPSPLKNLAGKNMKTLSANMEGGEVVNVYASGEEAKDYLDNVEKMKDWNFDGTHCRRCGIANSQIKGLLMQCGMCKSAYYCGKKCFNEDLYDHQEFCVSKQLNREAAAGPDVRRRKGQAGESETDADLTDDQRKFIKESDEKNKIAREKQEKEEKKRKAIEAARRQAELEEMQKKTKKHDYVWSVLFDSSHHTVAKDPSETADNDNSQTSFANRDDENNGTTPAGVSADSNEAEVEHGPATSISELDSAVETEGEQIPQDADKSQDIEESDDEEEVRRRRAKVLEAEQERLRRLKVGDGEIPEHKWTPEDIELNEAELIKRDYASKVPEWISRSMLKKTELGEIIKVKGDLTGAVIKVNQQKPQYTGGGDEADKDGNSKAVEQADVTTPPITELDNAAESVVENQLQDVDDGNISDEEGRRHDKSQDLEESVEEEELRRRSCRAPFLEAEEEQRRRLKVGDGEIPEHEWTPEDIELNEAEFIKRKYGSKVPEWISRSVLKRTELGELIKEKGDLTDAFGKVNQPKSQYTGGVDEAEGDGISESIEQVDFTAPTIIELPVDNVVESVGEHISQDASDGDIAVEEGRSRSKSQDLEDSEDEEELRRRSRREKVLEAEEKRRRRLKVGEGEIPEHEWTPEDIELNEAELIKRDYSTEAPEWIRRSVLKQTELGEVVKVKGDLTAEVGKAQHFRVNSNNPIWAVKSPLRRTSLLDVGGKLTPKTGQAKEPEWVKNPPLRSTSDTTNTIGHLQLNAL
jgi:hypothetical protein